MTVVVGVPHKGRVYLGADSQSTGGSLARHVYEGKLWSHGEMVFGLTGSRRESQILQYATAIPELPEPDDLLRWLCTSFVSAVREARKAGGYDDERNASQANVDAGPYIMLGVFGRLFVMYSDYQVCEYPDGAAIGSGEVVARGSLHTTNDLVMSTRRRIDYALAAACAHDIYCAPPFTYLTSPKRK